MPYSVFALQICTFDQSLSTKLTLFTDAFVPEHDLSSYMNAHMASGCVPQMGYSICFRICSNVFECKAQFWLYRWRECCATFVLLTDFVLAFDFVGWPEPAKHRNKVSICNFCSESNNTGCFGWLSSLALPLVVGAGAYGMSLLDSDFFFLFCIIVIQFSPFFFYSLRMFGVWVLLFSAFLPNVLVGCSLFVLLVCYHFFWLSCALFFPAFARACIRVYMHRLVKASLK